MQARTPYLVDTTLRDGEQSPGVAFSSEQRLQIAARLDALGIEEIEVGTPAMSEDDRNTIRSMVRLGLNSRLTGWGRLHLHDLACSQACGLTAVHLSLPASSRLLSAMGKDTDWLHAQLRRCLPRARRGFAFVSVGFQDASRMPARAWQDLLRQCVALGVDRIRLSDTVGGWTPQDVQPVFEQARSIAADVELGFHGHNDLGMATANAWTALQSGADCADVTVNGLGERAGNTALEQLAMTQSLRAQANGQDSPYDLKQIPPLCDYVARCSGMPIPGNQPVTGQRIFEHESGIHVRGMLQDARTYELYDPQTLGRTDRRIVLGRHSGKAGLIDALKATGIACQDDGVLESLLTATRRCATKQGGEVTRHQLLGLYQQILAEPVAREHGHRLAS